MTVSKGGRAVASTTYLAGQTASEGTLNLIGNATGRGVLETGSIHHGDGAVVNFNFNGGVLKAAEDVSDFLVNFATVEAVGGTVKAAEQLTLYGQFSAETAVTDFGDSYGLKSNVGMRLAF